MSTDTLDTLIPERGFPGATEGDHSAALEAFIDWHAARGLSLYRHQEEALLELYTGNHVILATPTGSGKSMVARGAAFLTLATGRRCWFTAPIKALVSEKFFQMCEVFGPDQVGLMTGDGTVNPTAPIICCTAEVLAQVALSEWEDAWADVVVMDEFHYYGDRERGMAWQLPLLTLPKSQFLLMSATLGDTRAVEADLALRTGRAVSVVSGSIRPVPLEFEYVETPLQETVERLVRDGKGPVYLVHFTQRACVEQAQALMSLTLAQKDEKAAIRAELGGVRFDTPFGKELRRFIENGVGLHHAGLLPRYRLAVEKLAQRGLLKVIVGTDTLGVGINVPIRSVLFSQLCKFDGQKVSLLSAREFHQIAGRAGRAGYDRVGYVRVQAPAHIIENARLEAAAAERNKKKFVKRKPPEFGYKHWDREIYERMVGSPPEALEPVFQVDHGMVLLMLQRAARQLRVGARVRFGGGYRMALELIDRSHLSRRGRAEARQHARQCLRDLQRAGLVRVAEGRRCRELVVDTDLQQDFSLHSSLSLWLVEAIDDLDPAQAEYGFQVISLVEAVQDSPKAILNAFAQAEKGRLIAALKAEGVPYEERLAALEDVSWPKPMADWIYPHFNAWCELHPWVKGESIAPKGILRSMLESWSGFSETINEYGLARTEGLLLRYLWGCWRTLARSVPESAKDDQLVEMEQWLRALLARVDSSLVTAWEALVAGDGAPVAVAAPVDISADPRAFRARIRAELHQLVRALSLRDVEEAAALCAWGDDEGLSPAELQRALDAFEAELGHPPLFDHRARLAERTQIEKVGPHQWRVSHLLTDPEEEAAWSIRGEIDLRADTDPRGRVVKIVGVEEG